MTDPTPAMVSFEQALKAGYIKPRRCELDPELYAHYDEPHGVERWAFVRLDGTTVTAFVNAMPAEPVDGHGCLQLGCAVPAPFRRRGLATSTLKAAIAELRHRFGRSGIGIFYVEGIVNVENVASRRASERAISANPVEVTDRLSGLPALQYLLKVETSAPG
ncbi:GNAT family N-acetyltransferase [Methylorubrum thiocyanatum]|uniref:GNAT family N-acetyltransferase n=1 Tax=Methylorubrum thiocyanatum TaxID=47958 RepID=UPI00398C6BFA